MNASEQWITVADIARARQRFIDAIPGWRAPHSHATGFVPAGAGIGPEHFPLVNTGEHLLPAAVLATVLGYTAGTAVYDLSPQQLDAAIALLTPAEACADYEHPNLWRWRDDIRPAWRQDTRARVIAVFLSDEPSPLLDAHPAVVAARAAAEGRVLTLRERLRALPVFDGTLPRFDVAAAPDDPHALFEQWLSAAITDGVRIPHAATLSTADATGDVSARTLILKDLDARGWWFASRTDGGKHRDLDANPRAAMTFLWREHGRQVRVSGIVADAGRPASDADFLARPLHSRAAAIAGTQSRPLASAADHAAAFEAAKAAISAHPGRTSETWSASILQALVVEFWATTPDAGQVRLEYRRDELTGGWRRGLLWP